MVPQCKKTDVVEVILTENMNLEEVQEFLTNLREVIQNLDGAPFNLLNNASEKSFADLGAVKALSVGMREIFATSSVKKVAVVRPQGDYTNEEPQNNPDIFQIFKDYQEAKCWLLSNF